VFKMLRRPSIPERYSSLMSPDRLSMLPERKNRTVTQTSQLSKTSTALLEATCRILLLNDTPLDPWAVRPIYLLPSHALAFTLCTFIPKCQLPGCFPPSRVFDFLSYFFLLVEGQVDPEPCSSTYQLPTSRHCSRIPSVA
jgi:hypothetical protein